MPLRHATAIAELAVELGLLTAIQATEAWTELGTRDAPAEDFLRVMERKGYLTPLQSAKLANGDREGYTLGGYRLLYKIATGGLGRVYRADDPSTRRVVALKV